LDTKVPSDEINDHLDKLHFSVNAQTSSEQPRRETSPTKNAFSFLGTANAGLSSSSATRRGSSNKSETVKPEKRRPMPNLCYAIMSEKELRKKCRAVGLCDKGNKKALQERHQRSVGDCFEADNSVFALVFQWVSLCGLIATLPKHSLIFEK
jgi:hypothetical protein